MVPGDTTLASLNNMLRRADLRQATADDLNELIAACGKTANRAIATLKLRSETGTSAYSSKEHLEAHLREKDVKLLRGDFVVGLWKSGGRFERRQQLPEEAYFTGSLLNVEVICISYAWLAPEHPDASRHHLGILAPLIEVFEQGGTKPTAIFLDYCSLYQHPRTDAETLKFKASLPAMNHLYGHQYTTLWVQSRMPVGHQRTLSDSGWCFFESAVAALGKRHHRHIDLGLLQVEVVRDYKAEVIDLCKAQRQPPLIPERFNEELRKRKFTNSADHASVEKLCVATRPNTPPTPTPPILSVVAKSQQINQKTTGTRVYKIH